VVPTAARADDAPGVKRSPSLAVGLYLFCPLRPLPRNVAFALTRIALSVITFALCLLTLPFSEVPCELTFARCVLTLVSPPSFVLEVAVGTAR
jgi:hypothetical protein